MEFIRAVKSLPGLSNLEIYENEPMAKHTTFKIGGNADYYIVPKMSEVVPVISLLNEMDLSYTVIGNGSNLLVSDAGYKGAIIEIGANMREITVLEEQVSADGDNVIIRVEAGALLSALSNKAAGESLTGLEFASGIPGNVGGGLIMNAGAYGGELKDVVSLIKFLDKDGNIRTYDREEYEGGYRTSRLMREGGIILEAEFSLKKGDRNEIDKTIADLRGKRVSKQPLEYPSAGSTFKRPEGFFAGKLIEDTGLRGYRVGGAMVSEKHCGFVINAGNATAADVYELILDVEDKVEAKFGLRLEPEVKFLGEFA